MGADATLVKAFTDAAMKRNPIDLSKYFQSQYAIGKGIMKGGIVAGEAFKRAAILKEAKAKKLKEEENKYYDGLMTDLNNNLNKTYKDLSTQEDGGLETPMNKKIVDLAWDTGLIYRNQLKEIMKGPKDENTERAAMDIMNKAARLNSNIIKLRTDLLTIARTGGDFDDETTINGMASFAKDNGMSLEILKEIMQTKGGWEGIEPRIENDEIVLNITRAGEAFTLKASDINKLIVHKDEATSTGIMADVVTYSSAGNDKKSVDLNLPYAFETARDAIRKKIRVGGTKPNLYDLIYREFDGESMSYAEAVEFNPIIAAARYHGVTVGALGPADADKEGEPGYGIVELTKTEEGYIDESGNLVDDDDWDMLKERLLKPRTPEEKRAVADDIAYYYAKVGEGKHTELRTAEINYREEQNRLKGVTRGRTKTQTGSQVQGGWQSYGDQDAKVTRVKAREAVVYDFSRFKWEWNEDEGEYEFLVEGKVEESSSPEDLLGEIMGIQRNRWEVKKEWKPTDYKTETKETEETEEAEATEDKEEILDTKGKGLGGRKTRTVTDPVTGEKRVIKIWD